MPNKVHSQEFDDLVPVIPTSLRESIICINNKTCLKKWGYTQFTE